MCFSLGNVSAGYQPTLLERALLGPTALADSCRGVKVEVAGGGGGLQWQASGLGSRLARNQRRRRGGLGQHVPHGRAMFPGPLPTSPTVLSKKRDLPRPRLPQSWARMCGGWRGRVGEGGTAGGRCGREGEMLWRRRRAGGGLRQRGSSWRRARRGGARRPGAAATSERLSALLRGTRRPARPGPSRRRRG